MNLIKIPSNIKTPTIVSLIESSNYELYKKQNAEKTEYQNIITENLSQYQEYYRRQVRLGLVELERKERLIFSENFLSKNEKRKNIALNHKKIISNVLFKQSYEWRECFC